ncbi:MAG TPA: GNAT family protein [Acidocella sp.]|nr:GNAT family protein [Acidocella sp.]
MSLPIGPEVDSWPRPLPARQKISGQRVSLEPLARRHAGELLEAAQFADDSFTYTSFGPWANREAVEGFIASHCADPMAAFWAVRPVTIGRVTGFLSLMNIEPNNAAIELGSIWFGPELRRTRAATEAMFLLLRHAADDLGYRRLVWKCDALNEPSRRAALRLGFAYEGTLRAHMVVKGRERDTAMYSILAAEWPSRRDAILAWLDEGNFDAQGTAITSLAQLRDK